MRINEALALTVGDVKDGFFWIKHGVEVSYPQGWTKVKTTKSKEHRRVSIEKHFNKLVARLTKSRKDGERFLVGGYLDDKSDIEIGRGASRKFRDEVRPAVAADDRKDFYSLKTTFNTQLRLKGVSDEIRSAVCGQSTKTINSKAYAHFRSHNTDAKISDKQAAELREYQRPALTAFPISEVPTLAKHLKLA
jgi:integrase